MIPIVAWMTSRLVGESGRYILIATAVMGAATFLYAKGHAAAARKCESAALRAQIAILKADASIARRAESDAVAKAQTLAETERAMTEKVNALQAELSKRPAAGACRLDRRDAQRLRGL